MWSFEVRHRGSQREHPQDYGNCQHQCRSLYSRQCEVVHLIFLEACFMITEVLSDWLIAARLSRGMESRRNQSVICHLMG